MLKSPAPLCRALLLSISFLLLVAGPLAAQNTPHDGAVAAKPAKIATHQAKVTTHHPAGVTTHHLAKVEMRHAVRAAKRRVVKVAKRHAVKLAKRRVVKAARQRAHHARAVRMRRVEVHERVVRIHVRQVAWARRHGRTAIVWPSHPCQIWAIARLPGYENRVRARPDRWAYVIEKIRHGTRFRVIGKARDHFGTLYYHVALRDGRIGWLNHACVRFIR